MRRGPSEAILTVASAALGSSGLRLDGVGLAPSTLGLAQEQLAVRALLGQSARLTVGVINHGDVAASLLGASVEADTPEVDYALLQSGCSGLLEGGRSCSSSSSSGPSRWACDQRRWS